MRPGRLLWSSALCGALVALTLGVGDGQSSPALEVASLGALLWFALLLLVTLAYALGRWGALQWRALAPLALLLAAIPAVPAVRFAGRSFEDRAFRRHLSDLEVTVATVSLLPGGIARLHREDLPQAVKSCCYRAIVRRDSVDRLSAVFVVHRQLAYLYDPTGTALARALARRWRHHTELAPNWHRLGR